MYFAAIPPEINSGRMYSGPGTGPLLAAATAWDNLAAELHATASAYSSVVSGLTSGPWQGPSSVSMAAAAAPQSAWLSATAAQAEQAGAQAKAAAAAHATAYAATVPPPVIAANRAQLATLVATNIFGQNTPAIAATEAHYAEMWAQDVAAMNGYAAGAQAASQVTPFTQPQQTADPSGLAGQNAAAGTSAGQASAGHAMSGVSQGLQTLASSPPAQIPPTPPTDLLGTLGTIGDIIAPGIDVIFDSAIITAFIPEYLIAGAALPSPIGLLGASPAALAAAQPLGLTPITEFAGLTEEALSGGANVAYTTSGLSAGLGQAASVSGMSVPPSWTTAAPEMRLAAAELEAAPTFVSATEPGGMFSGMPLMGGAPLMGVGGRPTSSSKDNQSDEEKKRKAAKGRRSSMH